MGVSGCSKRQLSHNQNRGKLEGRGQSPPQMGAAAFSLPYMVLGRPFEYRVLILTQFGSPRVSMTGDSIVLSIGAHLFRVAASGIGEC